jgi:hypothetical protein
MGMTTPHSFSEIQERLRGVRDIPILARSVGRTQANEIARILDMSDLKGRSIDALASIAISLIKDKTERWFSYSRTAGHRSYHLSPAPFWSYRRVVSTMDRLSAAGFVEHDRAPPGQLGWQSAVRAKPELHSLLSGFLELSAPFFMNRFLIVRAQDGSEVNFRSTRVTTTMERHVAEQNEMISSAKLGGAPLPGGNEITFRRIFNGGFGLGGRAYAISGSVQIMAKGERANITINDEGVIEPDHSNLHPRLLYAAVGKPLVGDAYDIPIFPRKLVKRAVNIAINAPTRKAAMGAIAFNKQMMKFLLGCHLTGKILAMPHPQKYLLKTQPTYRDAAGRAAMQLLSALEIKHQEIFRFFGSGVGLMLQAIDAKMADFVCTEARRAGVCVLPIHDSFLAPKSSEKTILDAMAVALERGQNDARLALAV